MRRWAIVAWLALAACSSSSEGGPPGGVSGASVAVTPHWSDAPVPVPREVLGHNAV